MNENLILSYEVRVVRINFEVVDGHRSGEGVLAGGSDRGTGRRTAQTVRLRQGPSAILNVSLVKLRRRGRNVTASEVFCFNPPAPIDPEGVIPSSLDLRSVRILNVKEQGRLMHKSVSHRPPR